MTPSAEALEGVHPPITASDGVRIERELRLLECQRLTAVRAPSDRSRFPANASVLPEALLALASDDHHPGRPAQL
jgi:hypothetical protein